MQHIKHHKKHLWQGVGLALLLLVYSTLPVWAANPQPRPSSPPYAQQLLSGTVGASLGFLGGATLATVALLVTHKGQLDQLNEAETRSVVWTILIGSGLGIVAGATWGVASTGERYGLDTLARAFLGASLAEAAWFHLTVGSRDIMKARYPLWPGLGIMLSGFVLPAIGAAIGYNY